MAYEDEIDHEEHRFWQHWCPECEGDRRECQCGMATSISGLKENTMTETCATCGVTIHHVTEPHWSGWLDEGDDQLSYVPTLHDHEPVEVTGR